MSDNFWAIIQIGGQLKKSNLSSFLDAIEKDGIRICNDEKIQENLDNLEVDGLLVFEDNEAYNGEFSNIEKWCKDNKHPFFRQNDFYEDHDAEMIWWISDDENGSYLVDSMGEPIVDYNAIDSLVFAVETIKEIKDVPLCTNSDYEEIRNYAKFSAQEGSINPVKYFRQRLTEICPQVPSIPQFEIIEG